MKESEARTKVCPLLSTTVYDSYKSGQIDYRVFCMASECMMWNEERKSGNTTYKGGCGMKNR
jgi:hypothetical protein